MISGGYARLVARWHWNGWHARHASIAVMDDRLAGRTGRRAGGINTPYPACFEGKEYVGLGVIPPVVRKVVSSLLYPTRHKQSSCSNCALLEIGVKSVNIPVPVRTLHVPADTRHDDGLTPSSTTPSKVRVVPVPVRYTELNLPENLP
jgi:hypothetical protein